MLVLWLALAGGCSGDAPPTPATPDDPSRLGPEALQEAPRSQPYETSMYRVRDRLAPRDSFLMARVESLMPILDRFAASDCRLDPLFSDQDPPNAGVEVPLIGFASEECGVMLREIDTDDIAMVHAIGRWLFTHPTATGEAGCRVPMFAEQGRCYTWSPAGVLFLVLTTPQLVERTYDAPLFQPMRCTRETPRSACTSLERGARAIPPYYASPTEQAPWIERLPHAGLALSYAAVALLRNEETGGTANYADPILPLIGGFDPALDHQDTYAWLVWLHGREHLGGAPLRLAMCADIELGLEARHLNRFQWALDQRFHVLQSDAGFSMTRASAAPIVRRRAQAFLAIGDQGSIYHQDNLATLEGSMTKLY